MVSGQYLSVVQGSKNYQAKANEHKFEKVRNKNDE